MMIYLDSHASTPVDQEVINAILPFYTKHYGNGNHKAGWKSSSALESSRYQVSNLIGASPSELVFTSGATEAINLALQGLIASNSSKRKHIVTQRTEHSAVLQCLESFKKKGYEITILDVDAVGRIKLKELKAAVNEETLVVAIMLANNEIGTVQPIKQIGEICRDQGAYLFCDLTQGLGWHPVDVHDMHIDLAAMSSHKIYGPRGVGALFVRRKHARIKLEPVLFGGGQERGLRPGTINTPGIVGFGKAAEILARGASDDFSRIRSLRDRLQAHISSSFEGVTINGCPYNKHPGNLNLAIPGVSGEDLIGALPDITFSTGSACTSGSAKPSYVVASLRVEEAVLKNAFRLGIGKFNTIAEISFVGEAIVKTAKHLQDKRARRKLPVHI